MSNTKAIQTMVGEEGRKGMHVGEQEFGTKLEVIVYMYRNKVLPTAAHVIKKNSPHNRPLKGDHISWRRKAM